MAKTPLMLACELNFTSIVSALLQAGANPFLALSVLVLPTTNTGNRSKSSESDSQTKAKRPHKKTALCWAVENGHEGIVDLLLGHHRHMLDTPASVETGETVSSVKEASTARSESVRSTLRLRHALQQPLDDVAGTDTESQVSASSSSSVKSSYRLGGWLSPTIPFMRSSTAITGQEIEFQERQRLVLEKDDSRYIAADDDLSDREESNYEEGDDMHSSMEADMHSITHLVGCCLLEAILLGHVAIAHLLLEHVHFYYQLQQQIHQDSEQKSSRPQNRWVQQALSKMYYRALSLSCQGHNRLMVRMMLAHLQEVNLPIPQLLVQYQTTLQGSNWQCLFGKNTPDESIVAMLQEQC
jgi:ankyrin repeat protein